MLTLCKTQLRSNYQLEGQARTHTHTRVRKLTSALAVAEKKVGQVEQASRKPKAASDCLEARPTTVKR